MTYTGRQRTEVVYRRIGMSASSSVTDYRLYVSTYRGDRGSCLYGNVMFNLNIRVSDGIFLLELFHVW